MTSHIPDYNPIQPFLTNGIFDLAYDEKIRSFVASFYTLKSRLETGRFEIKLVADGCSEFIVNMHDITRSRVVGFSNQASCFDFPAHVYFRGITFHLGALTELFNIDISQLDVRGIALHELGNAALVELAQVVFRADEDSWRREASDWIAQYVLSKYVHVNHQLREHVDHLTRAAIQGEYNISTNRTMRRWYKKYIGGPPSTMIRIMRLQHVLKSFEDYSCIKKNLGYLGMGFYDQAHFIRECKALTGYLPTEIFSSLKNN